VGRREGTPEKVGGNPPEGGPPKIGEKGGTLPKMFDATPPNGEE